MYETRLMVSGERIPAYDRDITSWLSSNAGTGFNGLPILLDRPLDVVALYLDPHGAMEEHHAERPILLLVTGGAGWARVGGPDGEMRAIAAGDAVLWPAGQDHTIWTENEPLRAIAIEGPAEREA